MKRGFVLMLSAVSVLGGCAAQPTYAPSPTPTPTPTPTVPVAPAIQVQKDRGDPCVLAFTTLLIVAEKGTPMIRQCRAGNRLYCSSFAVMLDRAGGAAPSRLALQCLEEGWIDPLHPLVLRANQVLPTYTRELEGMNQELGS